MDDSKTLELVIANLASGAAVVAAFATIVLAVACELVGRARKPGGILTGGHLLAEAQPHAAPRGYFQYLGHKTARYAPPR